MRPSVELPREECLRLLASKCVGRVAFQTENGLRILPVNYVLHDERIVFRTLAHGVIARSIRSADVAFQVDDLDEQLQAGWSVLAVGPCERMEDPAGLPALPGGGPKPWASGDRDLHFVIRWKGLSGRRLGDL